MRSRLVISALLAVLCASPALAQEEGGGTSSLAWSGHLESDLRYILDDWRGAARGDGRRFEYNRNELNLRLEASPDQQVQAVVDARLRFYGFNESRYLTDLFRPEATDPWSLFLDEAFVTVRGAPWDWLDLKLGRMIQNWGTADQFNPTDNLNARDLSDPMNYSGKVPNQMLELDAYPTDWLTLTAVWVPVFKPSWLPPSAAWGFAVEEDEGGCVEQFPATPLAPGENADLKALVPLIDDPANPGSLRRQCVRMGAPVVRTRRPEVSLANSQAAVKAAMRAGDLDLSLSYYYGRFSFPVAQAAAASVNYGPSTVDVAFAAELIYPRMQVLGADFSWSIPWLFDVGVVGEVAVIFPEEVAFAMGAFDSAGQPMTAIDGVRDDGTPVTLTLPKSAVNLPSTPFVKATAGFDYTFTSWLYLNAMYVRGFFDEFNDRYGVHNYLVGATELKFFDDELQVRLGGAWNADDGSAALNPFVKWIPRPAMELTAGVLWFLGETNPADPFDYAARSKFGQKAAGRDVAFLKARVSW
jgi:hypothetical protein